MSVQTIPELFLAAVHDKPRPDCFSYRDGSGQYVDVSSEEALRRVRALRAGLKSLGVKAGDRVAILSENRLEWALADLSAQCAGAVTVPIYPTLLPDTIGFILNDCQPVAVFVSTEEQAAKIQGLRASLPFLQDVISFEHTSLPDIMTFDKLKQIGQNLVDENPPTPSEECAQVDKDTPCSIIYTSGTTGQPKGVVLTHWNFVSNVVNINMLFDFGPQDRCLSFLPLSHVLERMAGYYTMLHMGVGIAYAQRPDTVTTDIVDVKPTLLISVPRVYDKIYGAALTTASASKFPKKQIFYWARGVALRFADASVSGQPIDPWLKFQHGLADKLVFTKIRARLGGRIRAMVSGGAPLHPTVARFFNGAGLNILEGYGLTETSPVLTCNKPGAIRFGSVGKTIPDTEIRIAEDGEIQCRGPQVMPGYYNNPEATAAVLDAEGWFSTGDIGHFDEEDYLYITDRKKDLIVTAGGKNVAPQPIENTFAAHKYVTQALVVGDRRQYLSALIVPDPVTTELFAGRHGISAGSKADLYRHPKVHRLFEHIVDNINADLPSFTQIRKFTLLDHEFTLDAGELTPTLKVKRFAIAKKYKDVIDAMYPEPAVGDED